MGIMDDAMVEAAAYTLEKKEIKIGDLVDCIRVLTSDDKAIAILNAKSDLNSSNRFIISLKGLENHPVKHFAYWMREETLNKIGSMPTIDPILVSIRVGMQTGSRLALSTPMVGGEAGKNCEH